MQKQKLYTSLVFNQAMYVASLVYSSRFSAAQRQNECWRTEAQITHLLRSGQQWKQNCKAQTQLAEDSPGMNKRMNNKKS